MSDLKNFESLEDIIQVDKETVKSILSGYDEVELVKATYIVSPTVIDYFQSVFPHVDFMGVRKEMGAISMEEAVAANDKVVELIRKAL